MKRLPLLIACLFLLVASNIYAAGNEPWNFSITPYVWIVDIDGDIEVGVPYEGVENQLIHIDEKFSDIYKHIHAGGMFDLNANKGKLGLFANIMFVNIKNLPVKTSDEFEINIHTKFRLYTVGASYRIYQHHINQHSKINLEPYFGVRYTKNNSGALLIEMPDQACNYAAHWSEPLIGAKVALDLNKHWSFHLSGDVGGLTSKKKHDSYNIVGLLGYKPIERFTIYLGYKQFYQFYTQGSGSTYFYWKMHEYGPLAGVTINL